MVFELRLATYFPSATNTVRKAILVKKSMNSYIDLNFSSNDLTVVVKDDKDETLPLASCYMSHKAPSAELRMLVDTANKADKAKRPLVIGTDASMHHTV